MREKKIEQQLVKEVKDIGGIALKIASPGFDGMPDRLILLPNRRLAFVEVKAPGKTLRPLQEKRKRQLEALGFLVFCLDNIEQIGGILLEIQAS
ncbi:VRR-NUC domain-containing protein [Clostridioides difficile]|uniref:VRR-NUC domain-containing protein n=1 Tax=Clostridioides difficile TaxID=1496 RepID=UPI0009455A85|nr:VRR-NUC domain-containing protein [Clostridioides difficile]DAH07449.1 MAG TPA: Nuclease [Caudoviricetes sp.]EGT3688651.1 VRR-NUC domain-containing protein [Clostridioides difficile]EKG0820789.1 VRR-NUC domain-containing protein [Clostridioides difficile]MBF9946814.1 VRR-NUC domain-containing protein [Clostridioides difficile]MBH7228378.1 VRR-NUC domain-containing protein [Clostridioides difficile]